MSKELEKWIGEFVELAKQDENKAYFAITGLDPSEVSREHIENAYKNVKPTDWPPTDFVMAAFREAFRQEIEDFALCNIPGLTDKIKKH